MEDSRDMWRACAWRWPLVLAGALLGLSLLWCAPALAISQRGHVFSFSYGSKGASEGQFSDPTGIAVNDSTGDVYVADRKNKRVVQLEPVLNGQGELTGEKWVRSFEVPTPSSVAVDDSTEGVDPSRGDLYVVGDGAKAVYKFSAEGVLIARIARFETRQEREETEAEEKKEKKRQEKETKLEGVEGVAVDSGGSLFVSVQGAVDTFNGAVVNEGEASMATGLTGQAEPGLALDSEDDVFVGTLGAGGFPVVSKLEGITGKVLIGALDEEESTNIAVNTRQVPGNDVDELNDVYVANGASVAQFAPEAGGVPGPLLQRFPSQSEEEAHGGPILTHSGGIAVDGKTGAVFATDTEMDDLVVFGLQPHGAPAIEAPNAAGVPPVVGDERLSAQVDPDGADTHYVIEYGSTACTKGACTKSASIDLGEGFAGREAALEVNGLASGVYHYRVVAANSFGTTVSPEHTFPILELVGGLPDGRAWEMVSPPNKHGAAIEALTREGGFILAAVDGDAFTYVANGAIEEEVQGNRSLEPQQALAIRTADGWRSRDIATPQERGAGVNFGSPEYQFFSPDLSVALLQPYVPEPPLAPEVAGSMVYLRDDQPIAPESDEQQSYAEAEAEVEKGGLTPGFLPLVSVADAPEATFPVSVSFLDATPDLEHIVFEGGSALTGSASAVGLYEWSQGAGLRFVSVLPNGQPAPASSLALGYYQVRARAVSSDGSRVIWSASQESPAHLYMRDLNTERTIQLDKTQLGIEPAGAARFQTASADGSRVFFTDDQALVEGASVEPANEITDLYECEMLETGGELTCVLHDLTIPLRKGEHAAVQGSVLGASEDGSSVYVVAKGVLAQNENGVGETARPGQDNLYGLHYTGGEWTRTFIATLSAEDAPDWDAGPNVSDENTAFQTARVSPDGEYLAFMSQRSLTGYDNEDTSSQHPGERLDQEVYLYSANTASLTCVSCDPTGARPSGVFDQQQSGEGVGLLVDRRESWRGHWLAGSIPGWTSESLINALYQSRYLSNQGRLFFDAAGPVLADVRESTRPEQVEDHSQQVGVENVYEYEPAGVGNCASSATGGCLALVSSGGSPQESAFMEATPSGDDVFFLTAAQLSPQDTDDAFDIYDARVCTSESPCITTPPGSQTPCGSLEECHPGSSLQPPAAGASGSATFSGPGNLTQPPPPKQEVKSAKTTKPKPLTRAQKLSRALAACRKRYPRSKTRRHACEAHARKLYAPKKKAGEK